MTEELRIWSVGEAGKVEPLSPLQQMPTELEFEELLVRNPEMLEPGLKLVGRQTPTQTGWLDLLAVDADGRMVVYELKRGTLARDALAQVLDYASDLDAMSNIDLAKHIAERSGTDGIERIDDFKQWYGDNFRGNDLSRPAVDTEVGTGHLPSLWAIRFVTPNPSLCDLNIGLAMDWERVQSLFPAHLALHAGMILFHPDADGPDWPHRQVTVACRHPTPDVENMRPCCVPEGCGSALDGKRRGTPARAQALLRRAEVAVCREDPARYPERSF